MTVTQRWKQMSLPNKLFVVFGGLTAFGTVFYSLIYFIQSISSFNPSLQPILRIRPLARDTQVQWPELKPRAHLALETFDHKSPFTLVLKNIGSGNAIDIQILFSMNIKPSDIEAELRASNVFSNFQRRSDEVELPLEEGTQWSTETVLLGNSDVRRVEMLGAETGHNEINIVYPPKIQNSETLWLLSKSFSVGQQRQATWRGEPDAVQKLMNDMQEKSAHEKLNEYWAVRRKEELVTCSEVTVAVKYRDLNGNEHQPDRRVIRAIYIPISEAFWANDKGHLYFLGGDGILSYEDEENPLDGFFNGYKHQGLL